MPYLAEWSGSLDGVTVEIVRLWLVEVDQPDPALVGLEAVLDDQERWRAGQLRDGRARRRFVAAHGAMRCIVGQALGAPPAAVRWRRGAHGKPELAAPQEDLTVNLSHSGGLAVVALAQRRAVGVDIQQASRHLDGPRLAARYFRPEEARSVAEAGSPELQLDMFVRLWVRKEACVKAVGARLAQGMRVPVASTGREALVRDPRGPLPGPYRVREVGVPPGFRAAVALVGDGAYRVDRHRWSAGALPGPAPAHLPSSVRPVLDRNTSSKVGRWSWIEPSSS